MKAISGRRSPASPVLAIFLCALAPIWLAPLPADAADRDRPHSTRDGIPLPREKPPVPTSGQTLPGLSAIPDEIRRKAQEDPHLLARRYRALAEEQARRAERAEEMAARARAAGEKLRAARAERVALAARLREVEAKLAARRAALATLDARIAGRESALADGRLLHARALGALVRFSRLPPALALFAPEPPRRVLRRAVATRALADDLVARSGRIAQQVTALRLDRSERGEELAALRREMAEQQMRRKALAAAIAGWQAERRRAEQAAAEERAALERIAREAADLRQLIEALEKRHAAARHFPGNVDLPPQTPPFAEARGHLVIPATGRLMRRFGARIADGHERGMTLAVPGGADVVAPWDGRVVFAAPFRSLGPLLIIAHGQGYHSLLAGLAVIYPVVGEWVLAGEPVGRVPAGGDGSKAASGKDRQTIRRVMRVPLYFELRQAGNPIDPAPWLEKPAGDDRS